VNYRPDADFDMAAIRHHESRWRFEFTLHNVTRTFVGPDAKHKDAAWTAQREAGAPGHPDLAGSAATVCARPLNQDRSARIGGGGEGIKSGRPAILAPSVRSWTPLPQSGSICRSAPTRLELAILQDKVACDGNAHLSALLKHANPSVVKSAQAACGPGAQDRQPIEMKFTGARRSRGGCSQLHGKVVPHRLLGDLVRFLPRGSVPNVKKLMRPPRQGI